MSPTRRFIDHRAWLALAWGMTGVFAVLLVALIPLGRWAELRMAACFFLPLAVVMLVRHGLPNLLLAFIAACFLFSAAGWAFDWYSPFWWFDVLLHGLNLIPMLAATMFMLWKAGFVNPLPQKGRFVLVAAGLGLVLGVAWELIEVTFLVLTWPDTILDVVMDVAGAALGGHFGAWIIIARDVPPVGRHRLSALGEARLASGPAVLRVRR